MFNERISKQSKSCEKCGAGDFCPITDERSTVTSSRSMRNVKMFPTSQGVCFIMVARCAIQYVLATGKHRLSQVKNSVYLREYDVATLFCTSSHPPYVNIMKHYHGITCSFIIYIDRKQIVLAVAVEK